jgi:hypothetical protein
MQRPQPDDDAWPAGHCSDPLICEARGKTQPAIYLYTKALRNGFGSATHGAVAHEERS